MKSTANALFSSTSTAHFTDQANSGFSFFDRSTTQAARTFNKGWGRLSFRWILTEKFLYCLLSTNTKKVILCHSLSFKSSLIYTLRSLLKLFEVEYAEACFLEDKLWSLKYIFPHYSLFENNWYMLLLTNWIRIWGDVAFKITDT